MQSRYNKRSNFDELRKNELTSRAGFGWEDGEEERLLAMRAEKSSYEDIAGELKRTVRSIQTRLYQHICKQVETESLEEQGLLEKYEVTAEELNELKRNAKSIKIRWLLANAIIDISVILRAHISHMKIVMPIMIFAMS